MLWALGFANPALLYGLAAASVPILLHLLNRRKYREVAWAAMRFLLAAIRKNRRRIRIEQWLLLAVRTLIILLVVAAMAKPFLESMGVVIVGRRVHRVLVLDASLSMGYTAAGTSRFDRAKALAGELVKGSRSGDAISVILMGRPPRVVIGAPSPNLKEVQKEVADLAITHGGTDLTATFEAIDRVLDASTIGQKEVLFLTDLQASSWRPPAGTADGLKRALAKVMKREPRSILIDLGEPGNENRAVTDLRLDVPVVTVGSDVLLRGVVHNYGGNKVSGVRARLTIDGRLGPAAPPEDLAPGGDLPVAFPHQFSAPGDHLVELIIDDDALALDNRRWLVVPVRESLNVLLVDGQFKPEPYQAETDYLAQALSPSEDSPGQPNPIKVDVVSESQLSGRELAPYDAIALCNVGAVSQQDVAALEGYLQQGGGVIIFGGDQVNAENYNRWLYQDGQGLLPASFGPSVGDASKKEAAFHFNPLGYRHPLISDYQGAGSTVTAGLTSSLIWQYHKLKIPPESKARVAMTFENNDPAIIEAPRHRGIAIVVATSADTGWTTWPLHKSYPPVMQQLVLHASAGRLTERNIRVGQPYDQSFPETALAAAATVVTPKRQAISTKLKPANGVSQFHFEQTDLSGPYQVRVGPPLSLESSFAANTDPAESDLTRLDQAVLGDLLPGWQFMYVHPSNWNELTQDAGSVGRRGELHRPMLYAVLVLLLVESILAWKFGHHEPA
jgi:Aerotolerance regulator N-terminal/von Willebrand factor type A domain